MKPRYWIALGVVVLLGACSWLLSGPGVPTPGRLAAKALSAGKPDERVQAVVELTLLQNPESCPQLRRVASESKDPDVVVVAINKLASANYKEYLPVFLDTLDHDEQRVREAACAAVLMGPGRAELDGAGYRAADPPAERGQASLRLKEIVKNLGQRKNPDKILLAAAPVASENPLSKKTEEAKKDEDRPPPDRDAPVPTPSVAPAPPPPLTAAPPLPQQEYPALQLLTWMCRVLAVLMLFAEVAGAFSLLLVDLSPAKSKNKQAAPTVEEQVERILAARNTGGLWSKIATLFGGAVCIVALLIAAEMIPLIPLAVRVEHKLDQSLRVR